MSQMTIAASGPLATLEIGDCRLPARMVAGRLRADVSRSVPLVAMPDRRRLRLAIALLMVIIPLVGATRRN